LIWISDRNSDQVLLQFCVDLKFVGFAFFDSSEELFGEELVVEDLRMT